MADEPVKVNVQSRRVDSSILPNTFSQPYRLYIIQQNTDMLSIANAANNAGELAYEATVRNEEQDVILADHESRILSLRVEVDDHEVRITGNTSAISALAIRVTSAEGNITTLQADISTLQGDVTSLASRVSTAEGNITTLQGDYVSKSLTSSQSLSSPLNVTTSYSIGGTKVVGARVTGFSAITGTAKKASINADYSETGAASYSAGQMTQVFDLLKETRQKIKAHDDALRSHGLID